MGDEATPTRPSRRSLVKILSLLPAATAGATLSTPAGIAEAAEPPPYNPTFFNADEWAFLNAACDRLIPADGIGPGAIEAGVLEFLDRHMQTPYAAGGIWYMQGPFVEAGPNFGYQGRLPLRDILRVGVKAVDSHCRRAFSDKRFSELPTGDQEKILSELQNDKIELEGVSAKTFFTHLLAETRNGYFSDPIYGGNRGMASWKMIGYPGARGDFLDWVEVRDRSYPLPPVGIAGRKA